MEMEQKILILTHNKDWVGNYRIVPETKVNLIEPSSQKEMKISKISNLVKSLVEHSVHSLEFNKLEIKEVNDMSTIDKILEVQFKLTQNMYRNMFRQGEFEEIRIPDLLSLAQEKKLVELCRSYY